MRFGSLALFVFILLLAAGVALILVYYPRLPDQVVSHFGPDGTPDGWSSKGSFATTYSIVLALIAAVFFGGALLIARIDPAMINLPNKKHWIAKERIDETRTLLARDCFWFGSATTAFFITAMNLTFRVSLGVSEGIRLSFAVAIGCYLLFTLLWTVGIFLRFKKVE